MDDNISLQVKRLIELDQKAIELENKREHELLELGQSYLFDKDKLEAELQAAKEQARRAYEEITKEAKNDAEAIMAEAKHKLQEAEKKMEQDAEAIALEFWDKILKDIT